MKAAIRIGAGVILAGLAAALTVGSVQDMQSAYGSGSAPFTAGIAVMLGIGAFLLLKRRPPPSA